ncbi:MAG: MAPEG family protein [Marinicella sp.]
MIQILIPVFLQVMLTFGILFVLGILRYLSVGKRTVHPKDYVLMTGQDQWPVMIQKLGRSFHNQLEVPILFYVLAVLILVTGIESPQLLTMAWVYVGLRYLHALIHISYNKVIHRFGVFIISCGWLIAMWIMFILEAKPLL